MKRHAARRPQARGRAQAQARVPPGWRLATRLRSRADQVRRSLIAPMRCLAARTPPARPALHAAPYAVWMSLITTDGPARAELAGWAAGPPAALRRASGRRGWPPLARTPLQR